MPQTTQKELPVKRSTGRQARQDWERLNLELAALRIMQKKVSSDIDTTKITRRIGVVTEEIKERIKSRRQKNKIGIYIRLGQQSVQFFLEHPQYIPLMKHEMARRYQARINGEDMRYDTLDNPFLNAHAEENAGIIYKGGICKWSNYFRCVRNNYIETMGRACKAAEMALHYTQPVSAPTQVLPPPAPKSQPSTPPLPPHLSFNPTRFPNHWKTFVRTNEDEVNLLLMNRCDDNVSDIFDVYAPESDTKPQRVKQQKYYQPTLFEVTRTRS